ncbi:BRO-N domain-containing protein [Mycoplasma sp. P36-A1]|uniref:BRO-N domain-containing protein n=1 Tax=Mycoplasma sp. P36-A1 TaxID=3252900 RepID=UPI003C2FE2FA
MNNLEIFKNNEFGEIRTIKIEEEIYFVGKDVAGILGYTNTRKTLIDHVDEEDKGVTKCDTLGGKQDLTIINESGLYSLILSSKLPSAKKFKRWVTSEVLPTIRKEGMYATDQLLDNPDLLIEAATRLKEERNKRIELEKQNEKMKPKALFADAVTASHTTLVEHIILSVWYI